MIFFAASVGLFLLLWFSFRIVEPALERLLTTVAHWMTSFRYGDYFTAVALLVAGVVVAGFAGDAFIDIAEEVQAGSPEVQRIDTLVHSWARTTHTPGATAFFVTMTIIGTPLVLGTLVVSVVVALIIRGRYRWAGYLALTTGIGGLLNQAMKLFFLRDRPDLAAALRTATGYSFPSGHAMGSAIVFGALSYLAVRTLPRRRRAAALAFALWAIVAISASRIYLGVHWISDVGAGLAAGAIWVVATTVAYEVVRRVRLVRALRAQRRERQLSS